MPLSAARRACVWMVLTCLKSRISVPLLRWCTARAVHCAVRNLLHLAAGEMP